MTQHVTPGSVENKEQFNWTFDGRLMVLDNGPCFASQSAFKGFMDLNTFAVVSFDPLNTLAKIENIEDTEELQIVANSTLGNGQPVTRYDCLNEGTSATLKPLPETLANTKASNEDNAGPNSILVQPTINSIALDHITGLSSVDWLLLDELNDNVAILQNGAQQIKNTLLIDIRIPFHFTHEGQADFSLINYLLNDYGFHFFRFQDFILKTYLPTDVYLEKKQYSTTQIANVLFLPTDERLENMPKNDLLKLGFLLHTVYKLKDAAYKMLSYVDANLAKEYLVAEGFLWPVDKEETEFMLTESYSPDIWAESSL